MNFKLKYFFRKPSENFHSIEELFTNFQTFLPVDCEYKNEYLPYHLGLVGRIKNILFAKKNRTQINHITGDVNYIALGLPKKNTILTIHDIGSALKGKGLKKSIIKLFWFKIPLKRVAKISVISEFSKNEILKTFSISDRKIKVIPNCVSEKFQYSEKKFNTKYPNILIVGTKENKNIARSLEALKEINCKVIIVGKLSKSQKSKLLDFEIDYDNVFNLQYDEVVSLYKKADLLLFPSIYEGFGVPILEAQASGLPLITSDLQPMNDVAGEGALLVNPFKIKDISDAIKKIISDENCRNDIVQKGLENVKKYRSKEIANMYHELYQEVLKNAER